MDDIELHKLAATHVSKGRHIEALSIYEQLSKKGYAACQVYAGWMLFEGKGVAVDRERAMEYLGAAAAQGDPAGMFYMGRAHTVNEKHEEAFRWYQQAAEKYYSPALYRLGVSYLDGLGVIPNKVLGYSCLEEAAKAGHVLAKGQLAKRYLLGGMGVRMLPRGLLFFFQAMVDAWRFAGRSNEYAEELVG